MARKVDIKSLGKVKNALDVLGKNKDNNYSPLSKGYQSKMKKADDLDIDIELNLAPRAFEEGSNSDRAARILKEVERRKGIVKRLRSNM